jgi:membrane-bound lytic murein transglycosylase D
MRILTALFFAVALPAAAQKVEVPHKLDFAGITLVIRDDARREIQKDVDALTASPRHYQIKAERAKTYFPIIEKIFREEGVPEDFKYLVLQESALISDAVSTSDAVGFWQFKDYTAIEMGLRVDREIDERLNIAASTRAAARYLIKNNQFFDNWLYALQSYQMGAGGVMKSVADTQAKATRMEITDKTYWYVKKFLAHRIAYEPGIKGSPKSRVVVFENRGNNTLKKIAKDIMVDEEALEELNKWARKGIIPDDRTYVVLLPVEGSVSEETLTASVAATRVEEPTAKASSAVLEKSVRGKINGIHTIQAITGDDARRLAARGGVDLPKFLEWNDLQKNDPIIAGAVYYLAKKRLKGSEAFHKVSPGESLWTVSQKYGLQLKRLKRYNRIEADMDPAPGTMLYLASRRPRENDVIAQVEGAVEVDKESFAWTVRTEGAATEVVEVQPVASVSGFDEQKTNDGALVKPVDSVQILQTNKTSPSFEDTASEVLALPANKLHTVKAGETLYGIARLYNVTVMELVEWNDLTLQQGIKPGQTLRLSTDREAIARETTTLEEKNPARQQIFHEVKTSDTLYSIARQYNVTIKQIMEWNEKKDFSLSAGEKLKILSGQ